MKHSILKFRIWDDQNDRMVKDGLQVDYSSEYGFSNAYDETGRQIDAYPLIVMQYTGIKDMKGKEIYDGDIVLVGDEHCAVSWWKENASWIIGRYAMSAIDDFDMKKLEIIGNIFENKDLLGRKKKKR